MIISNCSTSSRSPIILFEQILGLAIHRIRSRHIRSIHRHPAAEMLAAPPKRRNVCIEISFQGLKPLSIRRRPFRARLAAKRQRNIDGGFNPWNISSHPRPLRRLRHRHFEFRQRKRNDALNALSLTRNVYTPGRRNYAFR